MKKKLMNTTEKSPIARLVKNDAAEPISDENCERLSMCCISCTTATSMRKSSPRRGKVCVRNVFRSASGPAMLLTDVSMFPNEMFLIMLPAIGTTM